MFFIAFGLICSHIGHFCFHFFFFVSGHCPEQEPCQSLEQTPLVPLMHPLPWTPASSGKMHVLGSYLRVRVGGRIAVFSPSRGDSVAVFFLLSWRGPKQGWVELLILLGFFTSSVHFFTPDQCFQGSLSQKATYTEFLSLGMLPGETQP